MKVNEAVCIGGNAFTYVLTIVQTKEIFQLVSLIVSILVSIVILGYRIWKWWSEAKADGKITKEELKEGINIAKDGVNEIKKQVDDYKEKGGENKDGKD